MITKFGSLFAGHVDLEDVGLDGSPVNERWLSDEHIATVFDKTQAIAQLMDSTGYETLWLAEHHFQREGYECIPNILMLGVHLAHLTQTLKIGCASTLHRCGTRCGWQRIMHRGSPHRWTDCLWRGPRLSYPRSRGLRCASAWMETPIARCSRNRLTSSSSHLTSPPSPITASIMTSRPRFPYRGYELEEVTLVPRPLNLPVECWQPIVSASERGLNLMAKHGIKGMIGGGAAGGRCGGNG